MFGWGDSMLCSLFSTKVYCSIHKRAFTEYMLFTRLEKVYTVQSPVGTAKIFASGRYLKEHKDTENNYD
jgi:hypothetical protein